MGERTTIYRDKLRKISTTATASLGAIGLFTSLSAAPTRAEKVYEEFALSPIEEGWDMDQAIPIHATYIVDEDNPSQFKKVFDTLPESYSRSLNESLKQPLVKLALAKKTFNYLTVVESLPETSDLTGATSLPHDNGRFLESSPETKQVIVYMTDGKENLHDRIFISNKAMEILVAHETAHSLNEFWWDLIESNRTTDDPVLTSKLQALYAACTPVDAWLYRNVSKSLGYSSDLIGDDGEQNCTPSISMFGSEITKITGEQYMHCIDDGHMVTDLFNLDYEFPMGHPYDHASELIASVTTGLLFNPSYIEQCLKSQDHNEANMIRDYVRAALDLSFYTQPDIEKLLRRNPEASQTIDYLLSVDK